MTDLYSASEVINRAASEGPDIFRTIVNQPGFKEGLSALGLTVSGVRLAAMNIGRSAASQFLKTALQEGGKYTAEVAAAAIEKGAIAAENYLVGICNQILSKLVPPVAEAVAAGGGGASVAGSGAVEGASVAGGVGAGTVLSVAAAVAAVATAVYNYKKLTDELEGEGEYARKRYGQDTMGTRFTSATDYAKDQGARARTDTTVAVDNALKIEDKDKFLASVVNFYSSLEMDLRDFRMIERSNEANNAQRNIFSKALDATAETIATPFTGGTYQEVINGEEDITLTSKIKDGYRLLDRLRSVKPSRPQDIQAALMLEHALQMAEILLDEERGSNEEEQNAMREEKDMLKELLRLDAAKKMMVAKVQGAESDLKTRKTDKTVLVSLISDLSGLRTKINSMKLDDVPEVDRNIRGLEDRIKKIPRIIDWEVKHRLRNFQQKGNIPHKGRVYSFAYDNATKTYRVWAGDEEEKAEKVRPKRKGNES